MLAEGRFDAVVANVVAEAVVLALLLVRRIPCEVRAFLLIAAILGTGVTALLHSGPSAEAPMQLFGAVLFAALLLGRRGAAAVTVAVLVAIAAAVLIAPQHSEFATKVALLAALAFTCAARPTIERVAHARAAAGRTRYSRGRAFASVVAVVVILVGGARLATAARPDAASERRALSTSDGSAPDVTVVAPHGVDAPIDRPTALVIGHDLAAAVHGPGARLDRVAISVAERPGQEEPAVMATMWGHTDATHALHRSVEVQFRHDRWTIVSDDLPPGFVPPR